MEFYAPKLDQLTDYIEQIEDIHINKLVLKCISNKTTKGKVLNGKALVNFILKYMDDYLYNLTDVTFFTMHVNEGMKKNCSKWKLNSLNLTNNKFTFEHI
jgi:hypothetical protein